MFRKKKLSETEKGPGEGVGVTVNREEEEIAKAIELSLKPQAAPSKSNQEDDDLAKAIELSLKETSTSPKNHSKSASNTGSTLYPRFTDTLSSLSLSNDSANKKQKETSKVRALYDFEAAEDNELTFKAGEIILVLDDSDPNWWKGSNQRGEGLFPASFVTSNLDVPEPSYKSVSKKSVQFNEDIKVKVVEAEAQPVEIDTEKIDRLLHHLHEADPTGRKPDSDELIQLEEQCIQMNVLIDQELEKIDKNHASLTAVNHQLTKALNLYHSLMKDTYTPVNHYPNYQLPSQTYPNSVRYPCDIPSLVSGMQAMGSPLDNLPSSAGLPENYSPIHNNLSISYSSTSAIPYPQSLLPPQASMARMNIPLENRQYPQNEYPFSAPGVVQETGNFFPVSDGSFQPSFLGQDK